MTSGGVLKIVCSNNSEILKLLDSVGRNPSLSQRSVGTTPEELLALMRSEKPDIALLDAKIGEGSGYELCREIMADESLSGTRVILIAEGPLDDEAADQAAASGCTDIISMPMHSDDFYCHLSQFTQVQVRTTKRVPVNMEITLERDGKTYAGEVQNISSNGLGARVRAQLDLGPIGITIAYEGERHADIVGRVIWCRETPSESGFSVGLNLSRVPNEARELLVKLSLFQVLPNAGGDGVTVVLQGGFDERTNFRPLLTRLEGEPNIDFMMQGVTYLSSCGVRSWCLFVEELAHKASYAFRNCSPAFAAQAAMVPMTIGKGTVVSMQAPYFCRTCDREESRLIESKLVRRTSGAPKPPPVHCHLCKKALVFDDLPERYFAFLGDAG